MPKGVDEALTEETLVVVDPESGAISTGARAFAEIFRCLPFGRPIAWLLVITRPIADVVYRAVARNRSRISVMLGLAACDLAPPAGAADVGAAVTAPRRRSALDAFADAAVVLLLFVAASQLTVENAAVPKALRFRQPRWMSATVTYLQLFQGWSMFAPRAPSADQIVTVTARTADGAVFDPLNAVASPTQPNPGELIPPRLGYSALFCEYVARIPSRPDYHQAFREWLRRQGAISYEVREVTDRSPPPGEREPRETKSRELFRGP